MKKLIILLLFFNCSFQKTIVKTITNDKVLDYSATAFLLLANIYDSQENAIQFSRDNPVYSVDKDKWHAYKNLARGYMYMYGWTKGLKLGKAIVNNEFKKELKHQFKRGLLIDIPLAWEGWQHRYHFVRYNRFPDYRTETNEHRIMVPFFGKDRYINFMNSPSFFAIQDISLLSLSTIFIIKDLK